jgi:hypothetical protein
LDSVEQTKFELLGSLLLFAQTFYKLRTGRDFILSSPIGRESHFITICRALTKVFRGETKKLLIQIPPRYGKTELVIHFLAWSIANFPDSNNIYISYAKSLATTQTKTIRDIIGLPHYAKLFGIKLSDATSAKDNFETNFGGTVFAAGSDGPITGKGAGITGITNRWGGCIVIDDIIKPADATSDTIREGINNWYFNTLQSRVNEPSYTPIIVIGQETHEDSLTQRLKKSGDFELVILPALDEVGNALNPYKHTAPMLLKMKEEDPYVFASQYQQEPQPAGGGIFKPEWFHLHEQEPNFIETFLTIDTAETDKDYNDATVFSFWGLYKLNNFGIETDQYALHWIDCLELRVEPKDLQPEFMHFFAGCMRHSVKPRFAAIEKKSTGTTLLSVLSSFQGLQVIDSQITRTGNTRNINKTERFLSIQPYLSKKLVSLPRYGNHTNMCIDHCRKITANNSHRFDDIADTLYDAVKIALIDKTLIHLTQRTSQQDEMIARQVMSTFKKVQQIRQGARW